MTDQPLREEGLIYYGWNELGVMDHTILTYIVSTQL